MNDEWLLRYQRQLLLPGVGVPGQQRLERAHVVLIGLGGLGCASAGYLAGAGVGRISLIDNDRVESANLHRQLLFRQADIGQLKCDAAAATLRQLNPDVELQALSERATPDNLDHLLASADLVLDGSDNFATRYAINRACLARSIPLVSASAIGLRGQVMMLAGHLPDSPCYACVYPSDTKAADENCSNAAVLGPAVGLAGTLQAARALQWLLELPGAEPGVLWQIDLSRHSPRAVTLSKDPVCPECHH